MRRFVAVLALILGGSAAPLAVRAGEIGHYNGALLNVRDYAMPDPGLYGAVYNLTYTTDRLNDRHGSKVDSVAIAPLGGPGVTLGVDVDLDLYALVPAVLWVSEWKLLGAKLGAAIVPTFVNSSLSASLSRATGRGGDIDVGTFGVGDLFVQPVWLGWKLEHWDFYLAYGFYAPTGRYDTETVTFPGGGNARVESSDNLGYGFWTQQLQGAAVWYPFVNRATAVTAAVTYEFNQEKRDFDLRPGQTVTLNWGASQYLPLRKDQTLLLDVGPAGYSTWQTTKDTGSDASEPRVRDQVHAAGGQIGLAYVPWNASIIFHAFYEFETRGRFQGQSYGISLAKKFF
jgi:hypothetical protein